MKTNYRHCEESAAGAMTKQSNKKFFYCIQVKGLDWIASSCRAALAVLAMTCLLVIITTPAVACFPWLATWRDHGGTLPNSSHSYARVNNTHGTWSVTANFGNGAQVIHGDGIFIPFTVPPYTYYRGRCYCRMTAMEREASTNFSNARGSGWHVCSGNLLSSCVGPTISLTTHMVGSPGHIYMGRACASHCGNCIRSGSFAFCTRAAVLQ